MVSRFAASGNGWSADAGQAIGNVVVGWFRPACQRLQWARSAKYREASAFRIARIALWRPTWVGNGHPVYEFTTYLFWLQLVLLREENSTSRPAGLSSQHAQVRKRMSPAPCLRERGGRKCQGSISNASSIS